MPGITNTHTHPHTHTHTHKNTHTYTNTHRHRKTHTHTHTDIASPARDAIFGNFKFLMLYRYIPHIHIYTQL